MIEKAKHTSAIPLLIDVIETCKLLSISRSAFYSLQSSEQFGVIPLRLGGKVLYSRAEIEAYVQASTIKGNFIPRSQWQKIKNRYLMPERSDAL